MLRLKKTSPLLPRICQGPKKLMGSGQEAISYYFHGGHLPHQPCKGVHIRPQLPLQEVNENVDMWGPHFRWGTSILLTRSILPNTKNDKHKQRVFRSLEHECAYLYPDLGTYNGHKRLKSRLEKIIHKLGAKKLRVRFLRVTPHDLWLVL